MRLNIIWTACIFAPSMEINAIAEKYIILFYEEEEKGMIEINWPPLNNIQHLCFILSLFRLSESSYVHIPSSKCGNDRRDKKYPSACIFVDFVSTSLSYFCGSGCVVRFFFLNLFHSMTVLVPGDINIQQKSTVEEASLSSVSPYNIISCSLDLNTYDIGCGRFGQPNPIKRKFYDQFWCNEYHKSTAKRIIPSVSQRSKCQHGFPWGWHPLMAQWR